MKKSHLLILTVLMLTRTIAGLCEQEFTTVAGYPATAQKEDYELASGIVQAKDQAALAKMMIAGRVIMLENGKKAFLVEDDGHGLVRIRFEGDTETYWTAIEGIGRHKLLVS